MAARDNVLFSATVASGTSAGTVVPLSLLYGVENVRQGYGSAKLKNVRAFYDGMYSTAVGVPIEIKNSNWIDSAGLIAQFIDSDYAINRDSLAFMRGRDKALAPNTSWTVTATVPSNTTAAATIYVLFEIEYSDVPGVDTEKLAGSPVRKKCTSATVTGSANTYLNLGSFDNLLQGVTYVLSEAAIFASSSNTSANFLIIEGFSNQRGLVRILPLKSTGLADQIEGSVYITKQTYNLGLIRSINVTSESMDVYFEMIADKN